MNAKAMIVKFWKEQKGVISALIVVGLLPFLRWRFTWGQFQPFLSQKVPISWELLLYLLAILALACYILAAVMIILCNNQKSRFMDIAATRRPAAFIQGPFMINDAKKDSVVLLPTDGMLSSQGGISLWVFLHTKGKGIRRELAAGGNRYLFAHTTDADNYKNVFALSWGPRAHAGDDLGIEAWRLWLTNNKGLASGMQFERMYNDNLELGWNLFVIRWDKGKNRLEWLINKDNVYSGCECLGNWPDDICETFALGCWPNKCAPYFANTCFYRIQLMDYWPDEQWHANELSLKPEFQP